MTNCATEAAGGLRLRNKRACGRPLSRGYISKLLGNPIYFGRIAHKGDVYEGLHQAIIDIETWEAVLDRVQPVDLELERLLKGIPIGWDTQRRAL